MGRIPIVSEENCFEILQLERSYEINKYKDLIECKKIVEKMAEYCKNCKAQSPYYSYKYYEAKYYLLKNDYEASYICGLEGINHFDNCEPSYNYARLINFLGKLSFLKGEDIVALEYFLDAIEICKATNLLGFQGIIFNNLGCLYDNVKDYETALRYFKMCINYNQDDEKGVERKFVSCLNCAVDATRLKRTHEAAIYTNSAKQNYNPSFGAGRYTSVICVSALVNFQEGNKNDFFQKALQVYDFMCEDKVAVDGISEIIDLAQCVVEYDVELAQKFLRELVRIEKKFKVEHYDIDTAQLWIDIARAKKDNEFIFKALQNYSELSKKKKINDNLIKRNNLNSKIQLHETLIKNKRIQEQLEIDPLTRLYNRKALETVCAVYFEKAIFETKKIAVGLVDLDNFKHLNDNCGHLSGDDALTKISKIMRNLTEKNIRFVRYGGDEFLVLMFDCNPNDVSSISKNIKEGISQLKIKTDSSKKLDSFLTVSQGYYLAVPRKGETIYDFIKKADIMLYKSKIDRNTIHISCDE